MQSRNDFHDFIDNYSQGDMDGFFPQVVADIYVYTTQDGYIEIRFDIISKSNWEDMLPHNLYEKFSDKKIDVFGKHALILKEIVYYTDKKDREPSKNAPTSCSMQDSESINYIKSSITYQLPTTPYLALNLLSFLSYFIHAELDSISCVHLYCDTHPSTKNLDVTMGEYIEIENIMDDGVELELLRNIILNVKNLCASTSGNKYRNVFSPLQTILTRADQQLFPQPLIEILEIEDRCRLLHEYLIKKLFDRKVSSENKLNLLLKIGRDYISKNQPTEFNFLLKSLNYLARKNLFDVYYEKLSDRQKLNHNWDRIKLFVLKTGDFQLEGNKIYFKNSFPKKNSLKSIRKLAKLLKLDLEPYNATDPVITLTVGSTEILKQYNIHLTEHFIKRNMYKENFWSFFKRSQINENKGELNILALKGDDLQSIQNEMEAACNTSRRINKL